MTYNWEIEKRHLLQSNYKYFEKTFIEMYLERVCTSLLVCFGCLGNHDVKKKGKRTYLKSFSSEMIWSMKQRIYRNSQHTSFKRFCVFYGKLTL